jgi:branched-chain amino acid transport system substrate-binding protein
MNSRVQSKRGCFVQGLSFLVTLILMTSGFAYAAAPVAKKPILIGVLEAKTGVNASQGINIIEGVELAFDQIGYKIGDREIKLIVEDDEYNPEVIKTKTTKLVERDNVAAIIGPNHSAGALAVKDYLNTHKVATLVTMCTTTKLDPGPKNPYLFRPYINAPLLYYTAGKYCAEKLGYRRAVTVFLDFSAGYENDYPFGLAFERGGGKVLERIAIPMGTANQAPYIAAIKRVKGAEFVNANLWAGDAVRFVKSQAELGLGIPITGGDTIVADGTMLPSLGKDALGIRSYSAYGNVDTPENKAFVQAYYKKTKKPTNSEVYHGYLNATVLINALKAIGGNVEDSEGFVKALRNVKFNGPTGPFRFDQYQNGNIYFCYREVRRVDGELRNVVLDVVPDVVTPREVYEEMRDRKW